MRTILSKLMSSAKTFLLFSICLSLNACDKNEYVAEVEEESDPDEIGWIGEYTEGDDLEIDERAVTFKIHQVVTSDSLPIFQAANPAKKQKYGKRQIVSTTAKTRFTIRGIGFKARSDSSNVKCYIKKVEQSGIEIISWDSTQVVVDFPVLTSQLLIDNTFSIQFKIFVANGKVGRTNVSRSRSRSCISSVKAGKAITAFAYCAPALDTAIAYRRNTLNKTNTLSETARMFEPNNQGIPSYTPQTGDVLVHYPDEEGKVSCFVVISEAGNKDITGLFSRQGTCINNTTEHYFLTNPIFSTKTMRRYSNGLGTYYYKPLNSDISWEYDFFRR